MLLYLKEPEVIFVKMFSFALNDILLVDKTLVLLVGFAFVCFPFVEVLLLVLSFSPFPTPPLPKRQTGEAAAFFHILN